MTSDLGDMLCNSPVLEFPHTLKTQMAQGREKKEIAIEVSAEANIGLIQDAGVPEIADN